MCRKIIYTYACAMGQERYDYGSPNACYSSGDGADLTGKKWWKTHLDVFNSGPAGVATLEPLRKQQGNYDPDPPVSDLLL